MTFKSLSYTVISEEFIIPFLKIHGKNLHQNCCDIHFYISLRQNIKIFVSAMAFCWDNTGPRQSPWNFPSVFGLLHEKREELKDFCSEDYILERKAFLFLPFLCLCCLPPVIISEL